MWWFEHLLSRSGLASALTGVLEGLGIPWPGAVVLAAAGAEARSVSAAVTLALAFGLFYTTSAWLQYMVGRYCCGFLERLIPPRESRRLRAVMQKYGELAVLWTRPLAVGNYVSMPAGMIRMHQGKFLLYTFLGIMPWSLAITFGGSYLGARIDAAAYLLAAAALIVGAWGTLRAVCRSYRARKALRAAASGAKEGQVFAD